METGLRISSHQIESLGFFGHGEDVGGLWLPRVSLIQAWGGPSGQSVEDFMLKS